MTPHLLIGWLVVRRRQNYSNSGDLIGCFCVQEPDLAVTIPDAELIIEGEDQ